MFVLYASFRADLNNWLFIHKKVTHLNQRIELTNIQSLFYLSKNIHFPYMLNGLEFRVQNIQGVSAAIFYCERMLRRVPIEQKSLR